MKESDKAYLAALIDGEGSVTLYLNTSRRMEYVPDISIYSTQGDELQKLRNEWGFGNIKEVKRKEIHPTWKKSYCWRMSYLLAYRMAKEVKPFVRLKRKQIDLLLDYKKWISKQTKPFSKEVRAKQEEYRNKFKELNKRGKNVK